MTVLFSFISLPIGLWFQIRNLILFKQPLLYIWDTKNQYLYVGNFNLVERFLPSIKEIGETYIRFDNKDHSIISFIIRCSLFGEYSYQTSGLLYMFARLAVILNSFVVSLLVIITLLDFFNLKKLKNNIWKISLLILFILNTASYILMNIKLPYGCSMDFRYIVPLLFISLYCLVNVSESIKNKTISDLIRYVSFMIIFITFILSNIVIFFSPI